MLTDLGNKCVDTEVRNQFSEIKNEVIVINDGERVVLYIKNHQRRFRL